ncbi:hypothetical protein IWX84_003112, partial [Flavobacterium sp. CG_9.10]|uniref:T9SS type A sorting domain-containing protein n=1 Tax=Flavobacterium sp. CG_9.10 TaxID=2787729 RepID=UPI0018CA213A
GTGYYAIATGAAPTSCTSQSNPVNVVEVANPTALVLTGSSVCDAGTGTVSSSTSQLGVSYQLRIGTTNVQSAKTGAGAALLWSGLNTGTNYNVVSTGAAPTNCLGSSNNVDVATVNCAHIFPTQTTCSNYLCGPKDTFTLKKICVTYAKGKPGTIGNAIPGVFFYYGDFTATKTNVITDATDVTTIIVDQTSTGFNGTFDPQNASNIRLLVDDCQTVTPISITIGTQTSNMGDVTIEFKAIKDKKYIVSVKYDVKSIITSIIKSTPAYSTIGMKINGGSLEGVGKVDLDTSSTCSDTSVTPSGGGCLAKLAPTDTKVLASTTTATEPAGFDAYPVPFKDVLTIKYNFDYVSDVKIEVFNSLGKAILSKADTNSYLNKEVSLDLKMNKGQEQVYVVKVTTNRGSSTKKVMSSK